MYCAALFCTSLGITVLLYPNIFLSFQVPPLLSGICLTIKQLQSLNTVSIVFFSLQLMHMLYGVQECLLPDLYSHNALIEYISLSLYMYCTSYTGT